LISMNLQDYEEQIRLHDTWTAPLIFSNKEEADEAATEILKYLAGESGRSLYLPSKTADQRKLIRSLLNIRQPAELPVDIRNTLDRLLWTQRVESGIIEQNDIPSIHEAFGYKQCNGDVLALWWGDITCLEVDAIVNAANEELLGCFGPLHYCIDNAIHSAAGPQLRNDCDTIMQIQGRNELPGCAKITRAYNLPAKFVIHTVGPIVQGSLMEHHKVLLTSSYTACLDVAAEIDRIKSIAFCCISTGVYGFPQEEAAPLAVAAIKRWLDSYPKRFEKVIFDVYTDRDYELYRRIFSA
jgi:O-acetyl-ADP-ribose deacetylase (regulator of RNase III)